MAKQKRMKKRGKNGAKKPKMAISSKSKIKAAPKRVPKRSQPRARLVRESRPKVRFAVVGLGYISQRAILPAFAHVRKDCELIALVSSNPEKLRTLGRKYRVPNLYTYDQYDDLLQSRQVDAVFIALPNSMHEEYTLRAAAAGIHVLTEKPMASTLDAAERMVDACARDGVKLMVAYRLHFEEANMRAVEALSKGAIGIPRLFSAVFSMKVAPGNVRTEREQGGGALLDIGIYCINAARYLFAAEPLRVTALQPTLEGDERFKEVDGLSAAVLDFGEGRLATVNVTFDGYDTSRCEVIGTEGKVALEPAFDFETGLSLEIVQGRKRSVKTFKKRDQFAAEILHFAACVRENRDPEPSGMEGLADLRVIDAIRRSAHAGVAIDLPPLEKHLRPGPELIQNVPPVTPPGLIDAQEPAVGA